MFPNIRNKFTYIFGYMTGCSVYPKVSQILVAVVCSLASIYGFSSKSYQNNKMRLVRRIFGIVLEGETRITCITKQI